MTKEQFSGRYPTNCFGTFFVFSDLVRDKLYQAFLDRGQKIFKLDDVYITGILAKEAGVKHYNIRSMVFPFAKKGDLPISTILHQDYSFIHTPAKYKDIHRKRFLIWSNFVNKKSSKL